MIRFDITGKKFGKLTATEHIKSGMWKCKCDCGNECIVASGSLRSGRRISCGCLNSVSDFDLGINILFSRHNIKAKKRNLESNITSDSFTKIVTSNCELCGQIPNTPVNYKGKVLLLYNGIDRLDSTKHYTNDNSVPCCWICNRAKGNLSVEQYRQWLKQAYKYQFTRTAETTPGYLIDSLITVDMKCWWAQEDMLNPNLTDEEKARAGERAQELNDRRNRLVRQIDYLMDFSEDTPTEKTYHTYLQENK